MRVYLWIVVLLFMIGFVVIPSAQISSGDSVTNAALNQATRGVQQSKRASAGRQSVSPDSVGLVITVDTDGDAGGDCGMPGMGTCSLRAAIVLANEVLGPDTIEFSIGSGGEATISLNGALPPITQTLIIDGTTQPGYMGTPLIEIDGVNGGTSGGLTFETGASGSQVRGLAINRFLGDGIIIRADACTVSANYIGVGLDGVSNSGNGGAGIKIFATPGLVLQGEDDFRPAVASENTIGGNNPGDGNVIAFNDGNGVTVGGVTGDEISNTIINNSIFSNGGLGIDLDDDGVTPNDNCDVDVGANDLQNFPVLISATATETGIAIQGTLGTVSGNDTPYRIHFYASPASDPSLHGEGQTPIGFIDILSEVDCETSFIANFSATIASGTFITATATNSVSSNTSEFSEAIQATTGACEITCPNNVTTQTAPGLCSAVVNYPPPTTSEDCGTLIVTCTPPSGSTFQKGTTIVNCIVGIPTFETSNTAPTSCSFTVTVEDLQPPVLQCPADITMQLEPGQQSKAVVYPFPTVTDNCGVVTGIGCTPPSGSQFPPGTTTVTCSAADDSVNVGTCSFTVSVVDPRPPAITCPANINVQSNADCVAVVNYPPPVVSGTTGAVITCTPPSGSIFPAGTTTVSCAAVSTTGIRVTCSFTVNVTGLVAPVVTLEGGAAQLDFGTGPAVRKRDPNPTSRTFMIENTGCGTLNLGETITRTGADGDNGKITNPDDSETFTLSIVNANGTETEVGPCSTPCITIAPGQKLTFRVRFNRVIPPYAGKTTGLSAREVLPDLVTSRINFTGSASFSVPLVGRVLPAVQIVNPSKTKKAQRVNFERAGDQYVVLFGFHDANLNTSRVRYELLAGNGQVVETAEVDISQQISSLNPARGQALRVEQRFSGANDNPNITGVRVTVTDAEGSSVLSTSGSASSSAASIQPQARPRANSINSTRAEVKP